MTTASIATTSIGWFSVFLIRATAGSMVAVDTATDIVVVVVIVVVVHAATHVGFITTPASRNWSRKGSSTMHDYWTILVFATLITIMGIAWWKSWIHPLIW